MDLTHSSGDPTPTPQPVAVSPGTMTFTEDQQGNNILEKLKLQKEKGRFCDVVFHIQDRQYLAHRNVLAACSPYFDSMLKINKVAKEHMTVDCQNHEVFEVLLEYFYSGTIVIDNNVVEDLLKLSNRFMINILKCYCSEFLARNLTVSNCFGTKALAQDNGLQQLTLTVESFILANVMEIVEQTEVLSFSNQRLVEFVSHKTMPMTEELKLHLVCRWVVHSLETREYAFQLFVNCLQWNKANMRIMYAILQENPLFRSSEWCMFVLLQKFEERGCLYSTYRDSIAQLKEKFAQQWNVDLVRLAQLALSTVPGFPPEKLAEVTGDRVENIADAVDTGQDAAITEPDYEEQEMPQAAEEKDKTRNDCIRKELRNLLDTGAPENDMISIKPEDSHGDLDSGADEETEDVASESDVAAVEKTDTPPKSTPVDLQEVLGVSTLDKSDPLTADESPAIQPSPVTLCNPDGKHGNSKKSRQNKRKGIPVKIKSDPLTLRIPKSKLKLEIKLPKKRGRPPKLTYKKEVKNEVNSVKVKRKKRKGRKFRGSVSSDKEQDVDSLEDTIDDDTFDEVGDHDPDYDVDADLAEYLGPQDGVEKQEIGTVPRKRGRKRGRRKGGGKMQCSECCFETGNMEKLRLHQEKAHKDDTVYRCGMCDYVSHWNREYYTHMKTHFSGPPFR